MYPKPFRSKEITQKSDIFTPMEKGALYLGRISGIRLYLHWTFAILLVWIFLLYYGQSGGDVQQGLLGGVFILTLFACVTLHELGHALMGKRFQVETEKITLYPIGGVASMSKMPEKPVQELLVALAGPAVNLLLGSLLWVYLTQVKGLSIDGLTADLSRLTPNNFLQQLMFANFILALFNLIPAFPMDGGRVFRALLSMGTDRVTATRWAASLGQILAIGFVFLGFFYNFWLVFIGIFIYLGASAEAYQESTIHVLEGFKVRDVLMTNYQVLYPSQPLQAAVDLLLKGQDKEFIVLDLNGEQVVGILTRNDIIRHLAEAGPQQPISAAMRRSFITLAPDQALEEAMKALLSKQSPIAPVYENGRLLGVLDVENIQEFLLVSRAMPPTRSLPEQPA